MIRANAILVGLGLALGLSGGAVPASALPSDPALTDFDWSSYANPALVQDYLGKYHLQPTYKTFTSEDEAFRKLTGGSKVDVAHPCSQMVAKYRKAALIEPWDVSKIPHFAEIDKRFLKSKVLVDGQGVWYIPTDYAYTAIAYDAKTVPAADVASLQVFADPKYKGRVALPNNPEDVWALALLATGVSDWTNVSDAQFKAASDWLRKVNANLLTYWTDPAELAQLMQSGQVQVAWAWNDTVSILSRDGFPVGFQRAPKEGASAWFCGYVNLKDAPGSEQKAYDFINAFLDYPTAPVLLKTIGYATTETASMAKIPQAKLKAAFVDPVTTTLLVQTPLDPALSDRMASAFEKIKAGF